MTFRGVRILKEVDLILAEDTRVSQTLLRRYNIQRPLQSFHQFNEHSRLEGLMEQLVTGKTMALITDAGTPAISDPGFLIVRECLRRGVAISCLPGPTALIPALVQSGFPTDRFLFEGFLPHKKGRKTALEQLRNENRTMVFYESPHRLGKTLEQMATYFGDTREVAVVREISKIYEQTLTSTLAEAAAHFSATKARGEVVIVVKGA